MAAAAIATGAYAGFQVVQGLHNAEMIRAQGALQRQVSELNAEYAEYDAWQAEISGLGVAARYKANVEAIMADQTVTFASRGVDTNFGTARDIQEESRLTGQLNTIDLQNRARMQGLNLQREARGLRMNGYLQNLGTELNARAAITQGIVGAGRTVLSGYGDDLFGGGSNPNGHSGPYNPR